MNRFEECLNFVLRQEGGVSNHKADRGGLTAYGITQVTYDAWLATKGLSQKKVTDISHDEVKAIYLERYWQPCACSSMRKPIDLIIFDSAVQHGPSRAVKWLQQIVGTKPDGAIGPHTTAAISDYLSLNGNDNLVRAYFEIRRDFYDDIVEADPSQAVFAKGWENRLHHLEREIR